MNKIVLFLLTLCVVFVSCDKNVKQPLAYTVTNDPKDSAMINVYIPDSGAYDMPVKVKFLTGFQDDKVKLVINGLPANVTVTPDTFSAIPTYTEDFIFNTNHAALGTYQYTITAYTETRTPQTFYGNIVVVPADCASLFWGSISGSNACDTRNYTYTSTGVSTGTKNVLTINNFGGYGVNVNVKVIFDPTTGNVTIPLADYGNGTKLQGSGLFTTTQLIIYYTATTIPTGGSETCTVTYTR